MPSASVSSALALWTLVISGLSGGTAAAQRPPGFDIGHFEPLYSPTTNVLNIARSEVLPHLRVAAGVTAHLSDALLTRVDARSGLSRSDAVGLELRTDIWVALGLVDRLDVGVVLPVLALRGAETPAQASAPASGTSGLALGDLRLSAKVRLIDPFELPSGGFGLAFLVTAFLPTGDQAAWTGDGSLRVEPRLILDWRHAVGVVVAANLGVQLRPERQVLNLKVGHALRWGVGVEAPVGGHAVRLFASVFGTVPLVSNLDPVGGLTEVRDDRTRPVEALGGFRLQLGELTASVGGGAGIGKGVGAPAWRTFVSLGWDAPTDRDRDGLPDLRDLCVDAPEDHDGWVDYDGCPDGAPPSPSEPDLAVALDHPDPEPVAPPPPPDRDGDGIPDAVDRCPDEREIVNGVEDDDGCPDDVYAWLSERQVKLGQRVLFHGGSARLDQRGLPLLRAIAAILNGHPELTRVEIQGHTDTNSSPQRNRRLSVARARSVRRALTKLGVRRRRMIVRGFGEIVPVAPNGTREGRRQNRRVVFVVRAINGVPFAKTAAAAPEGAP